MTPKTIINNGPLSADGIDLTDEFNAALEVMEGAQEHAFITGRAGTGKSTLLRYFMTHTRRRAAVLARQHSPGTENPDRPPERPPM